MTRSGHSRPISLRLAILAVWCIVYGGGSAGLHSLFACHHDHAADTVNHQETNSPHWAGLKSVPATDSTCSVCTSVSPIAPPHWQPVVHLHLQDNGLAHAGHFIFNSSPVKSSAQPRAPPVS